MHCYPLRCPHTRHPLFSQFHTNHQQPDTKKINIMALIQTKNAFYFFTESPLQFLSERPSREPQHPRAPMTRPYTCSSTARKLTCGRRRTVYRSKNTTKLSKHPRRKACARDSRPFGGTRPSQMARHLGSSKVPHPAATTEICEDQKARFIMSHAGHFSVTKASVYKLSKFV